MPLEQGLQSLLDEALLANLELRASGASVQQRLAALDQARARYLPVIDFAARYSVADGGRTIDFPVGDLLNPVYETLDEMLVAQGQPPQFPRVRNESIALLRETRAGNQAGAGAAAVRAAHSVRRSMRGRPTRPAPRPTWPPCARRSCAT